MSLIHTTPLQSSTLTLTDDDRVAVLSLARRLGGLDLLREPEAFVLEAHLQAAALPPRLRRELLRFRRFGAPAGALLVRGLPVGEIPPTPAEADAAVGATLPAAAVLSIVVAVLGEQYGFRPESGGNLVQDIVPVAGFEQTQQSISSKDELYAHVEMAFTDDRADYVSLFCVRQDHDAIAATTVASIDGMLPLLDADTIDVLGEPRYETTVDASFLRGSGLADDIFVGPIRVLDGRPERPRLRVDFAETIGTDPRAQAALDALRDAATATAVPIELQAGDLVIVDNHRTVHGRTAFRARFDGRDRWLLRALVTKDLARSEARRPEDGRVVDADYR
jgi:L-asparagine oxygenase